MHFSFSLADGDGFEHLAQTPVSAFLKCNDWWLVPK